MGKGKGRDGREKWGMEEAGSAPKLKLAHSRTIFLAPALT